MTISIKGLNKADVLAALYNASRPQGKGFLQYKAKPMTRQEAEVHLKQGTSFDYLDGRVMKINLSGDELDTWGYDRDNGPDSAQTAIEALRVSGETNPVEVQAMHEVGKEAAADYVMEHVHEETTEIPGGFRLGLADVANQLIPAVDRARSKS